MACAEDESLKWPDRPERNEGHEISIFKDDADFFLALQFKVVAQEAVTMALEEFLLVPFFALGKIWNRRVGPDLAMGMRIAGTHQKAAILKNLDVVYPVECAEFRILLRPRIDHGNDGRFFHLTERKIVLRREA